MNHEAASIFARGARGLSPRGRLGAVSRQRDDRGSRRASAVLPAKVSAWWVVLALALAIAAGAAISAATNPTTLAWTKPTANCDGTPASIASFKIYWGTTGRVAAGLPASSTGPCGDTTQVAPTNAKVPIAYNLQSITVSNPAQVQQIIDLPADGRKYFFAMTAVGVGGESNLTNEVNKVSPLVAPPVLATATCAACVIIPGATVFAGTTGDVIAIKWTAYTSTVVVTIYEWPPKIGAVPVATSPSLAAGVVSWNWTAAKAGIYSARVCAGAQCSDSSASSPPQVYYLKLAAPGGIGIN